MIQQNKAALKDFLIQSLLAANQALSVLAQEQLLHYLFLLDKWNHTYNLTSVRNVQDMVSVHILDSLSILNYLKGERIIDVGTGAGLPGMPLAIAQPERAFTLLDSNGKKTRFLVHVLQQLKLTNVTVVQERAEHYKPEVCFTTVVSRAFSDLCDFIAKTQHLRCQDGVYLAMKGQCPHEELTAIADKAKQVAVHPLTVLGLAAQRHLICIS